MAWHELVTVPRKRRGAKTGDVGGEKTTAPKSVFKTLFGKPEQPGEDRNITKYMKSMFGMRIHRSVYVDVDPGQISAKSSNSDKTARSDEWIPIIEKIGPERGSAGHVMWFMVSLLLATVAMACLFSALLDSVKKRADLLESPASCFYAPYGHMDCNATCAGQPNGTVADGFVNVLYRLTSTDTARSYCECPVFRDEAPNNSDVLSVNTVYNIPCSLRCDAATP